MEIFGANWKAMFVSTVPVIEIVCRGSLVYLALFILLRVVLKREAGTVGIPDLLMIVLIADASQNAMSADYHSVTDGLILVATIVFWNYALDWLGFYVPGIRRLIEPEALPLIRNGQLLRKNMRKELVTEDELIGLLREQGIENIADVKDARMESDGRVSAIRKDSGQHTEGRDSDRGRV